MESSVCQDVQIPAATETHPLGETVKIDIKKDKILGTGKFGIVFEYTFNGTKVAVKRIQILHCDEANSIERKREGQAMTNLIHDNVLRLIEEQEDENFKYLIFELCVGTVGDYVQGKYKGIMPTEVDGLIQMASGLSYIHSQRFVHRDIKPENVLISQTFVLKISDFGFCKTVSTSGTFSTGSGLKGTQNYMAPEYLEMKNKSEEEIRAIRARLSLDIFSLGCVFFTYIKKDHSHLFKDPKTKNNFSITNNIVKGKKFLNGEIPDDHYAYKLIDEMTHSDPQKRLGLDEVIKALNSAKQAKIKKKVIDLRF